MRAHRLLLTSLSLQIACAGSETPPTSPDHVERPHSAVPSLQLPSRSYALPGLELTQLQAVHDPQLGDLVGAAQGLFSVSAEALTPRDPREVRGLGLHPDHGVLVAAAEHLSIATATLTASPVYERLEGELITTLVTQDDVVWLGTNQAAYRWQADELLRFPFPQGVLQMQAHQHTAGVLLQTTSDWVQLQFDQEVWRSAVVQAPWPIEQLFSLSDGSLIALSDSALHRRVASESGGWTWRAQALDLYEAPETEAIALAQDPRLGAVWCLTPNGLYRIDGPQVALHPLPFGPADTTELTVDNLGAVWLAEGPQLFRLGQDAAPVTWQGEIAEFSQKNCERCHAPLSTAHPLNEFELWTAEADAILSALQAGRMPLDGAPLEAGSADTIRRWIADGLLY